MSQHRIKPPTVADRASRDLPMNGSLSANGTLAPTPEPSAEADAALPFGYWQPEHHDLTQEDIDRAREVLEAAYASGKQLVVSEGITFTWHALATPAAPPLDVERLNAAMLALDGSGAPDDGYYRRYAEAIAREYAALANPDPETDDATPA